jgi:hypothetical protein
VATIYKVHPAIGVARIGNHGSAFFIGPESPGFPGVELGANGSETPVTAYKEDGRIKRQAARFRVFEYDEDAAGNQVLVGEVGSEAQIEWAVDHVNRKAALDRAVGPADRRNRTVVDRDTLVIRSPQPVTISGCDHKPEQVVGTFLRTEVYLGEIQTDHAGRLIVLGGRGSSGSVPAGAALNNFANNDRWYDDVSDGPIFATVTLPGQKPIAVHEQAWVVVGPPDFAPGVDATVSLYDIAYQCGIDKGALVPAAHPSFSRHIRPMVERTLALRWVDDWAQWAGLLPVDWAALADPAPATQATRAEIAAKVADPDLAMFELPAFLQTYLDQWVAGDFDSDLGAAAPVESIPQQLDRAALERCTGNNFFPGIEAGQNLKDRDIYANPFRLDRTNTGKVYPGCLTEIMALPWQADFRACEGDWWPTQRPDRVMTDATAVPGSVADWENPIDGYSDMVDNVQRLGFIVAHQVGDETVFVEVDRDPQFARVP